MSFRQEKMRVLSWLRKHPLLTLFTLGLLLRFILIFLDYSWDVNNHIIWAKDLWERGFWGFYNTTSSEVFASPLPNYPPLALFIFYMTYPLQGIIHGIAWFINTHVPLFPSQLIFFIESRTFLAAIMKLPAIFADFGLAWVCYTIACNLNPKNLKMNRLIAIFILFNPAFFYNSAYWGQIDVIPLCFTALSFHLLLFRKHLLLASTMFVFALLVKPTALVFLPFFILLLLRLTSLRQMMYALFYSGILFYLSFIPFLSQTGNLFQPFIVYSEKILAAQSLPYITNGAFNMWVLLSWFDGKDTAPFLLGLSYRIWGYIIVGLIYSFYVYVFFKQKKKEIWFYLMGLAAFACFLFLTKMHERYLMLPLPFILIGALYKKELYKWFAVLSFINFLNLYHSWPVPKIEPFVSLIFNHTTVVIIVVTNMALFLWLNLKVRYEKG